MRLRSIFALALLAYCGLVLIVRQVVLDQAVKSAQAVLDYATEDIVESVNLELDNILVFTGKAIARRIGSPRSCDVAAMASLAKEYGLDEINVISKDGVVVASSLTPTVGYDFANDEKTRPYLALLTGERTRFAEPFRASVGEPDLKYKYVAEPFEDRNGFVQVGYSERSLARDFILLFALDIDTWRFGETGYYLCVDEGTGFVLAAHEDRRDWIGRSIAELGFDLERIRSYPDGTYGYREITGGSASYRVLRLADKLFLAILPDAEFSRDNQLFWITSAILLVVIVVFLGFIARQRRDANRIAHLREEQDRRRAKDMALAESIQTNALPNVFPPYPALAGRFDIFASMRPAREVGGDFYDFFHVGSERLAIVIADVAGKGVPAALFMMKAQSALKMSLAGGQDLAEAVTEVNALLREGNEQRLFVTVWVGVVDLADGRIEYVNAGHNPPAIRRASGTVELLAEKNANFALAMMDGFPFLANETRLSPGDLLLLYTDGITEAKNADDAFFGDDRLVSTLAATDASAKGTCEALVSAVDAFVAGAEQADDLTLLACRFARAEKTFPATSEGLVDCQAFTAVVVPGPDAAVVFDELVSNIVRCSGASTFTVRVATDGTIELSDDGRQFDPLTVPDPDVTGSLEGHKIGGWGIYLVKNLTESLVYRRDGELNVLAFKMKKD